MHKMMEGLSFHKTGMKLLKIVHGADATVIPLALLEILTQIILAFAGLILSAHLIDALLGSNFRSALYLALATVLVNFIGGMLVQMMHKRFMILHMKYEYLFPAMLREKALSLDYETMERAEQIDKLMVLEHTESMYGGLGVILLHYQSMLKHLLTISVSLGMVVVLCVQKPRTESVLLQLVLSPAAALLMAAALFAANAVFSAGTSARYAAAQKEIFEGHTGVENKIAYLLHQVVGNYKAAKIIRIFDMKGMIMENVRKEWNKSRKFFEKMENTDMQESMTYAASNSVFTVLSYLLVAAKVVTGAVSIGSFTQYVGALNQFGSACTGLITENAALRRCCSYMQEFLDFMEMEGCHAKGTIPVEKRLDGEYELAFEDVSFHYPGSEEMVLKHITCRLNMKNKMAVVGRNGAGKTTFIKLLCRLYEPTEGRITLNGVDIRKYREEEYRDLFGVVFQDFRLFAFPVWENIAAGYAREDERIWEALRQAGAEGFVKEMPKQLETCLYKNMEEGVEISGGEAQKLAIARALYKDAALVILDEPTAALDPVAEAEVYARFDEMVKNKTSVYISHRMSSCRFCDDIIVFDEGRIVERGSHERLLEADGQYAKMWHAQAKYYA